MAYMHDWNCDVEEFSEEFIEDVKVVLSHHPSILRDVSVSNTYITFNGRREYGYETFCLETGRSGWCKTNINDYDKVVTTVLLLAHYYYGEKVRISSSGNHMPYINKVTKKAGGYFEESLTYIEETFGYRFEKEVKQDEDGNYSIDFVPQESKRKEVEQADEIASKRLSNTCEAINLFLTMLKEKYLTGDIDSQSTYPYRLIGIHAQSIRNFVDILNSQIDDENQEEMHPNEMVLERITELYHKMEDCMKKLEQTQSKGERQVLRNTIAMDAEVIGMYLQLVEEE